MTDFILDPLDMPHLSVIHCAGELDMSTGQMLLEAITERMPHVPVVVDLAAVTFIDAAGLGSLVKAQNQATLLGAAVCLAAPSESLLRLIDFTASQGQLELHPTVASATRATARTVVRLRPLTWPTDAEDDDERVRTGPLAIIPRP